MSYYHFKDFDRHVHVEISQIELPDWLVHQCTMQNHLILSHLIIVFIILKNIWPKRHSKQYLHGLRPMISDKICIFQTKTNQSNEQNNK